MEDETLVVVYDTRLWRDVDVFILCDTVTGRSWPRDVQDADPQSVEAVISRWRDRYTDLQAEHPDLPPFFE